MFCSLSGLVKTIINPSVPVATMDSAKTDTLRFAFSFPHEDKCSDKEHCNIDHCSSKFKVVCSKTQRKRTNEKLQQWKFRQHDTLQNGI